MPLKPEFITQEKEDALFAFPQGMHSGIAPAMLPKTQLGFLTNGTVRGDFPFHRPTFRQIPINFSSILDQTTFQTGKFQGAAVFNPIAAQDCLAVSISGKIFEIIPAYLNAQALNVTPGAGNPVEPNQVWMFQTERWLVINDGQSIPIFLDGTTSRRSNSGGFQITVQNVNDPNAGTVYGPGTNAQMKGALSSGILYVGASCPAPGGGGLAAGTFPNPPAAGGVPPAAPPAPPPQPPTTPGQPAPPAPTPVSTAPPPHWPWLPDNTNNWVPPP
jgi:hypothetical protein